MLRARDRRRDGVRVDGEVALGDGRQARAEAGQAVVGEAVQARLEVVQDRAVAERGAQVLAHRVVVGDRGLGDSRACR